MATHVEVQTTKIYSNDNVRSTNFIVVDEGEDHVFYIRKNGESLVFDYHEVQTLIGLMTGALGALDEVRK